MDENTNTGLASADMKNPPSPAKIRALRQDKGSTQAEAAGLLDVTPRAWQHWEAGSRPINGPAWRLFQLAPAKAALVPQKPALAPKRRRTVGGKRATRKG